MKRSTTVFFLTALYLSNLSYADTQVKNVSQPIKTKAQISEELDQAERDFAIAQEIFIPWYTGPLITGSASNVPFGHINIQPYLYFTINHAAYDNHRHSHSKPNTYILNPQFVFQAGLTKWLDVTTVPSGYFRWQNGENGQNFSDLPLQFGFQILREGPYIPNIRLIIGETFPTGKYRNLNPHKNGLDATGEGVFSTSFGLNISKIFWWIKLHPVAVRLATQYIVADQKSHVQGFHAFGGGYGTRGKVSVGNTFNADLGVEVSINQKWVFATDIAYTISNKSTFRGKQGYASDGSLAISGAPVSDQLSLAPAIEYNVDSSSGFIGGVWFSMTGRNSANFASIVLSYTKLF
jgi:hypothetical protein